MASVRVLVCEDDPRFRHGLVKLIPTLGDFNVFEASSGEEACQLAEASYFDLVLLDLELPGMDGVDVIRRLREGELAGEVMILTTFSDDKRLFEAIRAGAAGYLVKGLSVGRLARAMNEVLSGGTVLDSQLARRFWNHFSASVGQQAVDYGLTGEEIETLEVIARGLSTPEAADALGTTSRGVKAHLESIYRRMGVHSRVEAVVKGLRAGLIRIR